MTANLRVLSHASGFWPEIWPLIASEKDILHDRTRIALPLIAMLFGNPQSPEERFTIVLVSSDIRIFPEKNDRTTLISRRSYDKVNPSRVTNPLI